MSIILQGISLDEFYSQIKDCVKQEIENALDEKKKENPLPTPKTSILLTRKETAQKLGISLVTLHAWSNSDQNILPSYVIGTRVRYKLEDIEKLLSNPRNKKIL